MYKVRFLQQREAAWNCENFLLNIILIKQFLPFGPGIHHGANV